jgi:hypothetical protein
VLERAAGQARQLGARRVLWQILLCLLDAYQDQAEDGAPPGEQGEANRREAQALGRFFLEQLDQPEDETLRGKFDEKYAELLEG